MIETTKAIVLNSLKYGESSLITTCYTESYGVKSYLVKGVLKSRKGKLKAAYFQPLTQLNLIANHNTKGALNSIREIQVSTFYNSIYTNIKKQNITLFLAEVLFLSIKEEEENKTLFKYLETSFVWLDTHNNITNFHLLFLVNLTKFLGFYPEVTNEEKVYFNLAEGRFTNTRNYNCVFGKKLTLFKKVLGTNFDTIHTVNFNALQRQEILLILLQYFELHLSGFKKPKSLEILKSIFS